MNWNKLSEILPTENSVVIVYRNIDVRLFPYSFCVYRGTDFIDLHNKILSGITHWRPIPDEPLPDVVKA